MNTSKQQYIETIRSNSAYPVYRGFISTIAILIYLLAALDALAALIMGFGAMRTVGFISGLGILIGMGLGAVLTFLLAKFFKEAAQILADIADSTAEANSRTLPPQAS